MNANNSYITIVIVHVVFSYVPMYNKLYVDVYDVGAISLC